MKQKLLIIALSFLSFYGNGQTIYFDSTSRINKSATLITAIDTSKMIVNPFPLKLCVWSSYDSYNNKQGASLSYEIYTYGDNPSMVYNGVISFTGSVYDDWEYNSTAKSSNQFIATQLLQSKIYIFFQ